MYNTSEKLKNQRNPQNVDTEKDPRKKRNEASHERKATVSKISSSRKSQEKTEHDISAEKIYKKMTNTQGTIKKSTNSDSKAASHQRITNPTGKRILKQEFFPSKMDYNAMLNHLKKSEETITANSNLTPNKRTERNENAQRKSHRETEKVNSPGKLDARSKVRDLNIAKKSENLSTKKLPTGKSDQIKNSQIQNERKSKSFSSKPSSSDLQNVRHKLEDTEGSSISETSSIIKSPLTSTLKKGSILDKNIEENGARKESGKSNADEEKDTYEYEDDFDSYESDFESYNSSDSIILELNSTVSTEGDSLSNDESVGKTNLMGPSGIDKGLEKKLDSGNFDLNETNMKTRKFIQIQEAIEQDNVKFKENSNYKSNMTSLSDEGFEESKSLQFLNFAEAKKKQKHKKDLQIRMKRGEELLSMIKLDFMNFTLFQLLPVPYDEYIRRFGNFNSVQISTQTGEKAVHEETQTENISEVNKWVQVPPFVSRENLSNLNIFKCEHLGVGSDDYLDTDEVADVQYNSFKLDQFLSNSLPMVFNVLLERKFQNEKMNRNDSDVNCFGEYLHRYQLPSEFVGKRKFSIISINPQNTSYFLSVQTEELHADDGISLIYYWNINEDVPMCYFSCYGKVVSCCFGSDTDTVLAGLENGLLVIWNRKSNSSKMCPMIESDVALKSPIQLSDLKESHCSRVIALQTLSAHQSDNILDSEMDTVNYQVCSLDSEGVIILWNIDTKKIEQLLQNNKIFTGIKVLYKTFSILLRGVAIDIEDFVCTRMTVVNSKPVSALVTTSSGRIVSCTLHQEKINFRTYKTENETTPTCLCLCPFSNKYFLVGDDSGQITLFSEETLKPLMVISNKENENFGLPVNYISWSEEKPCNFFTVNSKNNLDIWDMSRSIVSPIESVALEKEIIGMELSSLKSNHNMYFMITATTAIIYLHVLSSNPRNNNTSEFKAELQMLMNFLRRL